MTDVFTKEKRSQIMSRIKGSGNTATEIQLIKVFKEHKVTRWRRDYPAFGKPDFVFLKSRVAIFVDGEFWHGHPTRAKIPASNREFWETKIEANKKRDQLVNKVLRKNGWLVIRVWQKDICKPRTLNRIKKAISSR